MVHNIASHLITPEAVESRKPAALTASIWAAQEVTRESIKFGKEKKEEN